MTGQERITPTGEPGGEVARLGQELARHSRMLHLFKGSMAAAAPPGLDWAAVGLLIQLVRCGPRRQSDFAEVTMLDPSTVSRYAAQLVREGLAERRPDPNDGRAVQLVATDTGVEAINQVLAQRNQLLLRALRRWDPGDVATLTDLLTRFNDDLEASRQAHGRAAPSIRPHR